MQIIAALSLVLLAACGGEVFDAAEESARPSADAGSDCAVSWSYSWPTYFPGETAPSFDDPVGDAGVVLHCTQLEDGGSFYVCR